MAHLNYFPSRVACFNFCFFIAVPSDGVYWYYAKWCYAKQTAKWTCKIVDIPRNCEVETVATDAARLMATAVATDSRRRFLKRWHVADVKNITEGDHTTLIVNRNFANIAHTFRFYVKEIVTDAPRLMVAFGDCSNGTRQKHRRRWPG